MKRVLLGLVLTSCDGASKDLGLDTPMQVDGAQFYRAEWPGDTSGPQIETVSVTPVLRPGAQGRQSAGELAATGTAIAISFAGGSGYWVLPAKPPGTSAPGFPTFAASLNFAKTIAPGNRDLSFRGVDESGHFGPPLVKTLTFVPRAPTGHLVVTLAWQNRADLDLHVVDPAGAEIYARSPTSYQPPAPGSPEPPGTPHDGGVLDFDSNAQCMADGREAEDVVWSDPPPRGHYVVRVDTPSLCGEVSSPWTVQAVLEGVMVASASGTSAALDTRFSHGRGAGILAFEFDVP